MRDFDNDGRPLATVMEALHFLRSWVDGRSSGEGELRFRISQPPYIESREGREGDSGGDSSWRHHLLLTEEVIRELKDHGFVIGKPYMGGRHNDTFITTEKGEKYYCDNYFQMSPDERQEFDREMDKVKMWRHDHK